MIFDEVFSEQVFATGNEDGRVITRFFARARRCCSRGSSMANGCCAPAAGLGDVHGLARWSRRDQGWSDARGIREYVEEQQAHHRQALGLDDPPRLDDMVRAARKEL
jgi:hypothetical protein